MLHTEPLKIGRDASVKIIVSKTIQGYHDNCGSEPFWTIVVVSLSNNLMVTMSMQLHESELEYQKSKTDARKQKYKTERIEQFACAFRWWPSDACVILIVELKIFVGIPGRMVMSWWNVDPRCLRCSFAGGLLLLLFAEQSFSAVSSSSRRRCFVERQIVHAATWA